jgi:hypothetical protein
VLVAKKTGRSEEPELSEDDLTTPVDGQEAAKAEDAPRSDEDHDGPAQTTDGDPDAITKPEQGAPRDEDDAFVETYSEAAEHVETVDAAEEKADQPESAAEADSDKDVIAEELIADSTPADEARPAAAAPAPEREVVVKKQGLMGGVIGGAVAAVIGFGVAQVYPDGWPIGGSEAVESTLAAQSTQLDGLAGQVSALSQTAADSSALDGLQAQIVTLSADLEAARAALAEAQNTVAVTREGLTGRLDALATNLTGRIVTLEKAPIEQAADAAVAVAVQAYEDEVAALRDETQKRFDALSEDLQARLGEGNAAIVEAVEANQRMEAERAEREAAARAAEQAARRALAMSELRTALETGAPFADSLRVLPDAPAPLADLAASGVPTRVALAEAFPPLAREALIVALRETGDGSPEGRLTAFVRTQLGVRSLAPREGDDPDAVLSRMEAAVAAGDYEAAVETAAALPDPARAVLSDWLSAVETRAAAVAAADALDAELNTN